jgi:DDE family transposase
MILLQRLSIKHCWRDFDCYRIFCQKRFPNAPSHDDADAMQVRRYALTIVAGWRAWEHNGVVTLDGWAYGAATPQLHAALQQRDLLPVAHSVDTGVLDADLFVKSRDDYDVDLLGPTRLDYHWQARAGAGFDAQHFQINWDQQHATCPAGKTSISWRPAVDNRGNAVVKVKFSSKDCRRCDHVAQCVRSTKRYPRRTLTIRPQPQYQALQVAQQREATDAFQAEYARCAGIEGAISREIRTARLRRTRYIGLACVHLGHILTAVGLNVLRL